MIEFHFSGPPSSPPTAFQKLSVAVRKGDIYEVQHLCDTEGVEPRHVFEEGETLLFPAATSQQLEVCAWLIEQGASIAHRNSIGRTALLTAIHARDGRWKHQLIALLEPSINIADNDGLTPLMRAAKGAGLFGANRGNLQILKRLIKGGADVFAQDNRGLTALGHANIDARSSPSGANDEVVGFLEHAMVEAAAKMEFHRLYLHYFSSKGVLMLQHRLIESA